MFVTVDPERDTTTWLNEFVRYMPKGFSAVTGTDAEIAATAADWGVRYAREDTGVDGDYAMSHTADVYLVDRAGMLRARFPFGTEADVMTAVAREVAATAAAAAPASAAASSATPTATPTSGAPSTGTPSSPPATARPERHSASRSSRARSGQGPQGPSSSRCP